MVTETCIQCGGHGRNTLPGLSKWPCGFCNGSGIVPIATQWLLTPYQAKRPLKRKSDMLGWFVVGAFLTGCLLFMLLFANQLANGALLSL